MTHSAWIKKATKFLFKAYAAVATIVVSLLLLNGMLQSLYFYYKHYM